eukprot:Lankesteria_metandrocarpae@DN5333_c2_g1_i7.p1
MANIAEARSRFSPPVQLHYRCCYCSFIVLLVYNVLLSSVVHVSAAAKYQGQGSYPNSHNGYGAAAVAAVQEAVTGVAGTAADATTRKGVARHDSRQHRSGEQQQQQHSMVMNPSGDLQNVVNNGLQGVAAAVGGGSALDSLSRQVVSAVPISSSAAQSLNKIGA